MSQSAAPHAESPQAGVDHERIYGRNYRFFLSDYVLFTIALQLIGPTTVVPDFVRKLTSAEILIGISSQMFDVGWLLPQLLIARQLVRVERKKWWFIGPNIPARLVILIFAGWWCCSARTAKPRCWRCSCCSTRWPRWVMEWSACPG